MLFDEAFTKLIGHEGGYVDHPSDTGGATRWGVTERVARANGYTGQMRELPVEFAKQIYRRDYWDAVKADYLPHTVRYAVFDAAVNSGVRQSAKWLQQALGVSDDGVIGSVTINAAKSVNPSILLARVLSKRLDFMTSLPGWHAFGKGWARRIASLMEA